VGVEPLGRAAGAALDGARGEREQVVQTDDAVQLLALHHRDDLAPAGDHRPGDRPDVGVASDRRWTPDDPPYFRVGCPVAVAQLPDGDYTEV
jgi:hypothetical protein